ncbi:acyl-CoA dehydrogenase family protein [Nocardioides hungaricus]
MILLDVDESTQSLRDSARRLLAAESSSVRVRELAGSGQPARALDQRMAQLGWFGIEVPDELGGAGATLADLRVLVEELGRHSASSRLCSSGVLATGAILLGGSTAQQERWLPDLGTGGRFGTIAFGSPESGAAAAVVAKRTSSGWRLDGSVPHVLDAVGSDLLVVAAHDQAQQTVVLVIPTTAAGVVVSDRPLVDLTRRVGAVVLDGAVVADADVLARGRDAEGLVSAVLDRAAVALAADSVGVACRVVEMTAAYAKQREQFGRKIGSFQAVKHQAADMLVTTEAARVLTEDAWVRVSEDPFGSALAASMVKDYAVEVAAKVAGTGIQLHGGIGYTWEHDLHLLLKRAKFNESFCGGSRWHRRRSAAAILADR